MSESDPAVFEEPARWRLVAARALGLHGEELMAGVTTGAAYPVAIEPIVRAVAALGAPLVLDVGSGAGGIAEWIAARTGARMVGLEPSSTAAAVASTTFERVDSVRGAAEALPFRTGTFDAVTLLGTTSLVVDLDHLIVEVTRVLRSGGVVGISDLCLDERGPLVATNGPNTFRSLASLVSAMQAGGFEVDDIAAGAGDLTTRWSSVIRSVDDEIEGRFCRDAAFSAWAADRDELRRMIRAGDLVIGTVVAHRAD